MVKHTVSPEGYKPIEARKRIIKELRAIGLYEDWRGEAWLAVQLGIPIDRALDNFLRAYGYRVGRTGKLYQVP